MERPAIVWLNGYFGRLSKRCVVVGETPKRYRVRWLEAVKTRGIEPGNITLVPKHAVEFIEAGINGHGDQGLFVLEREQKHETR